MVNQKPICFKIDLENLEGIDDYVREASSWTTRNRVLNNAVQMYLEYVRAKNFYNYEGDPAKMKDFVAKYLVREPARLFT